MALLETVQLTRADLIGIIPGVDVDVDVILEPDPKAYLAAQRRTIEEWINEDPDRVVFKIRVKATVLWVINQRKTVKVRARDLRPLLKLWYGGDNG